MNEIHLGAILCSCLRVSITHDCGSCLYQRHDEKGKFLAGEYGTNTDISFVVITDNKCELQILKLRVIKLRVIIDAS
jgi:hypothetical protein